MYSSDRMKHPVAAFLWRYMVGEMGGKDRTGMEFLEGWLGGDGEEIRYKFSIS